MKGKNLQQDFCYKKCFQGGGVHCIWDPQGWMCLPSMAIRVGGSLDGI